jgi:hypothetical protein
MRSAAGLPRAVALYGPLPKQLEQPDSFASQLARMLKVRAELRLYAARVVDVPAVQSKGLLVLVHELPDNGGLEVTAINFAAAPVAELVPVRGARADATAKDVLDPKTPSLPITADGNLQLRLNAYECRALRITG